VLLLVPGQLRRATEPDAGLAGAANADSGARLDEAALELGEAAQHRDHQASVRLRGVGPVIGQRLERRATLTDLVQHIEQIARRASEPIKPADDQGVALTECGDGLAELRAVGACAGLLLGEDGGGACAPGVDIVLRCSIFFVPGGWSPAMELGASLIAIFGLAIFDWGG